MATKATTRKATRPTAARAATTRAVTAPPALSRDELAAQMAALDAQDAADARAAQAEALGQAAEGDGRQVHDEHGAVAGITVGDHYMIPIVPIPERHTIALVDNGEGQE